MNLFLREHKYIDFSAPNIKSKAIELFEGLNGDIQKAKAAYEFVRDEVPHMFDIKSDTVTAKASDVLKYKTGICHAKANLLAALLRLQNIPTGFCYQRITLANDNSRGYALHCYNAVYIENRWIKVDARGNTAKIKAQFSLDNPVLAYPCRKEYGEYFFNGIYAAPHNETMQILERVKNLREALEIVSDMITDSPDITDDESR